jgi:pimeloyl-ACP methyl ester carboxylesterase
VAGLYASRFNDKLAKLILYAPYTVKEDPTEPKVIQMAYATMTPKQRVETFRNLTPPGRECRMESEMFESFGKIWLLSDPLNKIFKDDSVRFPAGPKQDEEDLHHNKPCYNPADIRVPVLLVRGEWDQYPNNKDAEILFTALENARYKKYVVIEKATHILHLEKSRYELYDEVLYFLNYGN